ncbi:MAG: alpha/beta hydrolase [Chloroflexota bacterium]|nr:alpha/beta hydrolase [Chloroflexota bacterium]MDE2908588.1 alpha/beta hydrolase [Chloroflexota bacterium]
MPPPLIELAGEAGAPLLHLAPANGFPPMTYEPLLRKLSGYRAVCAPPRALWGDQAPPTEYRDWHAEADDLLAGLAAYDLREVVAVGHSLGGVVSMLALLKAPERFKALIMLDPPILAPGMLNEIHEAWAVGKVNNMPLVAAARRRRQTFASREEAFKRFRQKRLFADWSAESLWHYVAHGLRRRSTGGYELVWSADWEAHYFSTVYLKIWEALPRLTGAPPALIARGGDSDTLSAAAFKRIQAIAPALDGIELAGQGHLFPLAAPAETGRMIVDWLAAKRV